MHNVLRKLTPLALGCGLLVAFGACSDDSDTNLGKEAGVDMKAGDMKAGDMKAGDMKAGWRHEGWRHEGWRHEGWRHRPQKPL